ncbi:lactonase family protein [Allomuricauda sp. SCSIO 65647]|uniref:lactonase family protein n=1 Tax=Allomuricauda sp. SCSIO 65647 TaxID=2908843 RepID=UPI001F18F372|nr:lactonase family protein [Muricauda sp. SCSIO 65647]UJH68929.1 lactonase family protein [Muricauda sp. SCSIO 65647]
MNTKIVGCLLLVLAVMGCSEKKVAHTETLFVGTYTDGTSEGIYTLQFNAETGALDSLQLKAKLPNPSFLAVSEVGDYLYAVQETADFDSLGGGVTAFSLENGVLEKLNSKGSGGAHPCHAALSGDGQLAVSNYSGGNLAIFDLEVGGELGQRQLIDHKALDTTRQAHTHKAHFSNNELFAADLGLDAVKRYQKKEDEWRPAAQASLDLPNGAGPRHFVFNDDQSRLYVINELNSTITLFEKDEQGSYEERQTVQTLADDYGANNSCADIHLSPDGRFLYGSNRGENTIVIFAVDAASGELVLVGRESVHGDWPRNFVLDPSGNHLLVANQNSNNISVFKRDTDKGTLHFLNSFELGSPVCLVFLKQ